MVLITRVLTILATGLHVVFADWLTVVCFVGLLAAAQYQAGFEARCGVGRPSSTLTKGVGTLASGALSGGNQFPIKLGAAAIMTIPVALLFFVFQKQIMNTTSNAVKD
jgi:ABC-type glycerol-3-phosphate transport system permease component